MIDQELVFPAALKAFFPPWLDYCLHTVISFLPIFEMMVSHNEFKYRRTCLQLLLLGLASYAIWIHVVYLKTSFWVYDIFAVLTNMQRQIFFIASGLVGVGLYFVGEMINLVIVGKATTKRNEKKKR